MAEKSVRPHLSQRQAAADCINQALEKSDIAEICHAIAAATHLYNISDLAQISGLARPSIHRAFAGDPKKTNFATVFIKHPASQKVVVSSNRLSVFETNANDLVTSAFGSVP